MDPLYIHALNKSIAKYTIFRDNPDYLRFLNTLKYYQYADQPMCLSEFLRQEQNSKNIQLNTHTKIVNIISYCLMPTHFHLLIEKLIEERTSFFLSNVLNSYTRYFNTRYTRKGPLWQARTKQIPIKTNEQFLQLTLYQHANPVKAGLVRKCSEWTFSSYADYTRMNPSYNDKQNSETIVCNLAPYFTISGKEYTALADEYVGSLRFQTS